MLATVEHVDQGLSQSLVCARLLEENSGNAAHGENLVGLVDPNLTPGQRVVNIGKFYFLSGIFWLEGRLRTRHNGRISPKFLARRPLQ